jgi:bacillopeptidase F
MQIPDTAHRQILLAVACLLFLILVSAVQGNAHSASLPPRQGEPPTSGSPSGATQRNWPEAAQPAKFDPLLLKRLLESKARATHRVIIELVPQANLASVPPNLNRAEQRRQVVEVLQGVAGEAQEDLLVDLQSAQVQGQASEIRPFCIFNSIALVADTETLLSLAARADVRRIREDRWHLWVDPPPTPETTPLEDGGGVEWNIARVQADLAWSASGLDGSGVTVGIMDSGADWQHSILQAQYRGYRPGEPPVHHGNWACTTDEGYLYPVDGYGHGTHVTGLAVGGQDESGTAIGDSRGADH